MRLNLNINLGAIVESKQIEKLTSTIYSQYKYYAEYYYIDPMGSTFSNENDDVIIAYGNDKIQLAKYVEGLGYKPSEKLFDGGYTIKDNKNYKSVPQVDYRF